MPYIGNTIRAADDYRLIDDISSSFNGSTTSFALQVAGSAPVPFPKSPQQVLISVNGVIQEPDPSGSSGFNLVGTNLVFSSAPTNGHAFFGIIYATADYLNAGGNFPAGSLGAPSITFIGDENSGLYRKGGGSVGFVSDATEIANFDSNGITISSGNLILGDSSGANDDRIKLGASGDLQLFHNGTHSYIVDAGTGGINLDTNNLYVRSANGNETLADFNENGAVNLYYDNAKKAETVTGGFTVTGVCTATSFAGDGSSLSGINTDLVSDTSPQLGGNLDVNTKNIVFGDSAGTTDDRLTFGAGTDLQIYHQASNNTSYLYNTSTDLTLMTGGTNVNIKSDSGEFFAKFVKDGEVELYHNNVKKFQTYASGIQFFGNIKNETDGTNQGMFLGAANDFQFYHDGNRSAVNNRTGDLRLLGAGNIIIGRADSGNTTAYDEQYISCTSNGAVELFHDNAGKYQTASNGGVITGGAPYTELLVQTSGGVHQGKVIGWGSGNTREIGFAEPNSQQWFIRCDKNTSTGTRNEYHWQSITPAVDNSYDLGNTSYRWRNIFTHDLNLSNEGHGNDVDGTWGSYTIQEGAESLFLINNRNGKKYKFDLTEVS